MVREKAEADEIAARARIKDLRTHILLVSQAGGVVMYVELEIRCACGGGCHHPSSAIVVLSL